MSMPKLRTCAPIAVLIVTLIAAGPSLAAKSRHKKPLSDKAADTALFKKLFAQADDASRDVAEIAAYLVGHTVPSAVHANLADSATHAGSADSAGTAANATGLAGPLAAGQTERGDWAAYGSTGTFGEGVTFPIPLVGSLDPLHVHYVTGGKAVAGCPGTAASPAAASGNLCVYERAASNAVNTAIRGGGEAPGSQGADPSGFVVEFLPSAPGGASADGTWAVSG
jgi:hypothetical protein